MNILDEGLVSSMYKMIASTVDRLVMKYGSRDPFVLSDALGITIWQRDIGVIKGLYNECCGYRYIVINEGLPEAEKRIICAHELGHDQINPYLAKYTPLTNAVYDIRLKPECEANLFASILLIPPEDIISFAKDGYTVTQIAQMLNVSNTLVELRLQYIQACGG